MFISKKEVRRLEKRIADLEGQVQSQQKVIDNKISESPRQSIEKTVQEVFRESYTDNAGNIVVRICKPNFC